MSSRRKSQPIPVVLEELEPVVTDLRYWLIHALHWHALLIAVIAVIFVGRTMFSQ